MLVKHFFKKICGGRAEPFQKAPPFGNLNAQKADG